MTTKGYSEGVELDQTETGRIAAAVDFIAAADPLFLCCFVLLLRFDRRRGTAADLVSWRTRGGVGGTALSIAPAIHWAV